MTLGKTVLLSLSQGGVSFKKNKKKNQPFFFVFRKSAPDAFSLQVCLFLSFFLLLNFETGRAGEGSPILEHSCCYLVVLWFINSFVFLKNKQ